MGESGWASWWRVCYQRGLPRLVFVGFTFFGYILDLGTFFVCSSVSVSVSPCHHIQRRPPSWLWAITLCKHWDLWEDLKRVNCVHLAVKSFLWELKCMQEKRRKVTHKDFTNVTLARYISFRKSVFSYRLNDIGLNFNTIIKLHV